MADDLADQAFGAGDDRRYEQLAALLRVIAYLGSLGAAGYVLVGGALRLPDDPSPLGPRVTGALVAALLALLALVPLQGVPPPAEASARSSTTASCGPRWATATGSSC